jgi:hypothetical protein
MDNVLLTYEMKMITHMKQLMIVNNGGELVAIEKLLNIVITLEHIESKDDVFDNEHPKIKYYVDMPRNHVATTKIKPTKITINIDEPTCEVEEQVLNLVS